MQTSAVWSTRQADIIQLSRLAKEANAPGNEMFYSRRPRHERAVFARLWPVQRRTAVGGGADRTNRISDRDDELLLQITVIQATMTRWRRRPNSRSANSLAARNATPAATWRCWTAPSLSCWAGWTRPWRPSKRGGDPSTWSGNWRGRASCGRSKFSSLRCYLIVCLVALYGSYIGRTMRAGETLRAQMLDEVAAARDRLQHYANDVSHELRGPISKMRLDAEVLLRHDRTGSNTRTGSNRSWSRPSGSPRSWNRFCSLPAPKTRQVSLLTAPLYAHRELALIVEFFAAAAGRQRMGIVRSVGQGEGIWADRALFQRASPIWSAMRSSMPPGPRKSCSRPRPTATGA